MPHIEDILDIHGYAYRRLSNGYLAIASIGTGEKSYTVGLYRSRDDDEPLVLIDTDNGEEADLLLQGDAYLDVDSVEALGLDGTLRGGHEPYTIDTAAIAHEEAHR